MNSPRRARRGRPIEVVNEPPPPAPRLLGWLREGPPVRRELVGSAWVAAVVSILFYFELALPHRIVADYDAWTYFYPLRTFASAALNAGWFPFWNPDTFLGAPFFANPQTAVLYPGSVLFYAFPVPYAFSLSILLHVALAIWFFYWFGRQVLGVGPVGASVGAATFALGGFVSSQTGHLNQFCATAWTPAVALAADQALRHRSWRWTAAAGGALGVQLLAGHAQETYLTLWVLAVLLLWRTLLRIRMAVEARRRDAQEAQAAGLTSTLPALAAVVEHGQRIAGIVSLPVWLGIGIAALGFGLAAIQLIPTAELSTHSIRSGGMTYQEGIAFSLPPQLLVRALLPGYWFNPPDENVGYIGGVGLGLAALALLFSRRPAAALATGLAGLGLFFALGGANPLYRWFFEAVPGLNLFRVPARWLVVYTIGAASLAALGADWLLTAARARPSLSRAIGTLALLIAGVALGAVALPTVPLRIALLWIVTLSVGWLFALLALRWRPKHLGWVLAAIVVVELRFGGLDLPARMPVPAEAAERPREVPAFLMAGQRTDRILSLAPVEYEVADYAEIARRYPTLNPTTLNEFKAALKLDEVMTPNVPIRYGLATADGYDGGVLPLRRYLTMAALLVPAAELRTDGVLRTRLTAVPEPRLLELFGIGRVIANRVQDVERGGIRYDVATARSFEPGESGSVTLERPVPADWVGLLASHYASDVPDGQEMGELRLIRTDGEVTVLPLPANGAVYHINRPGPENAPIPAVGAPPPGRADTAVRLPLPAGAAVQRIDVSWRGPRALDLRALTLGTAAGSQEPIVLHTGLHRTLFQNLKVYETTTVDLGVRLVPTSEVREDPDAITFLRRATREEREQRVMLAPGATPQQTNAGPAVFTRTEGGADFRGRFVYQRVTGEGGGYLVVDDGWFPGWQATIDGQPAPVERANVYYKTIWVPPDGQRVVLTYTPNRLQMAAGISGVALLVILYLLIRGRFP